jgi:beta-ketoacyl-acyl-carrier-protein synthase II
MDMVHQNGWARVVVTGMGVITPLGSSVDSFWQKLLSGESGIKRIQAFDPGHLNIQIAGEATDFDPTPFVDRKKLRRLERSSHFAIALAKMAMEDAGLSEHELQANPERTATVFGTALGGYDALLRGAIRLREENRKLEPFAMVATMLNTPGHYISRAVHAAGPLNTVAATCAAGTQAIGEAAQFIRSGRADIVFTGGVESLIQDYVFAAFDAMTVLARDYNDKPTEASRPFSADRNGFVYSEGGAVLVLESLEHAHKRGARIYAEVLGHGVATDYHHSMISDPKAKAGIRAIRCGLKDACLNPEDIDYINPHGSGTQANDSSETYAIKSVFGKGAYNILLSATKSMIGHSLGAAGAIEAVACIKSLQTGIIHPTINYHDPDPECDLDCVPDEPREANLRYVMNNSSGLGGQNASLILGQI